MPPAPASRLWYTGVTVKPDLTIGFLGAGNMAEALVRGLVAAHLAAERLWASDPDTQRVDRLRSEYGIHTTTDNRALAAAVDVVVLAVKPDLAERVLAEVAPSLPSDTLVISIVAGITSHVIEDRLAPGTRVVRTMPNTPALVLAGATAIARGHHATEADIAIAELIFGSVGITVALDESKLDAVTGLSGSGPAYAFVILEALADAGVKVGLTREHAQRLAAQTVMGSAKMLLHTGTHPAQLKDMVTSPGGTSIAGVHALERGGLRATLIDAVEAATARSRALGRVGDDKK